MLPSSLGGEEVRILQTGGGEAIYLTFQTCLDGDKKFIKNL